MSRPWLAGDRVPVLDDVVLVNGAAKAASLDTPRTTNVPSAETDGVRTVRFRIQGPADAHTTADQSWAGRPSFAGRTFVVRNR
ncbi:hypothetical protein [Streptomyces sp. NBC_01237]|uniref:hypothetical protein n=1 Tax=Streptomyces sp. NBC_01237 TaxID=2903790 RepID=UPI002DD80AAF|nr:hypothetical protein [Streptomyces sp. NBC_01237]WRZ77383.1 hypothetical protein OG251_37725 [Streptomyces sp. NBC_01237]